jgi:hypothetical protein
VTIPTLIAMKLSTLWSDFGTDESDARTHRTPKALRAKSIFRHYLLFRDSFGSAHASSRRFFARDAQLFAMLRLK